MKKKYSIIISMCIFCIALVAIGVYAVSYLKLDVSGQIDFVAYERIVYIDKVEIKNYVETNGDNYQAKSKERAEFSGLYLRDSDKISTIDLSRLSVLQNEELIIEITMISLSPDFSLDVVCEYTQKAGITVTPSQTQLPKNEGEKVSTGIPAKFTITISTTSTGIVNLADLSIKISFARTVLSSKANYMHISFDDVTNCFTNLASGKYTSLWDEPFFAWLKQLNTTYGAKFSLYTYTTTLSSVGATFATEFAQASTWLKLGMHSNTSGHIMTDIDYATGKLYWNAFVNNVIRITGTANSIDRIPRLESFGGTFSGLFGMRDASNGALGFLSADDDRNSYYFNTDITSYLYTNDYVLDSQNTLKFISTDIRADWFDNFSTANAYRAPVKNNVYDELVYREENSDFNNAWKSIIFFVHEWQLYSGVTINNAKATWVSDACQYAQDYNLDFDYPQNRNYTSTTGDDLFDVLDYSEKITLTPNSGSAFEVKLVYKYADIDFSVGQAIASYGAYITTAGRAASNGYALAVAGGEVISLTFSKIEGKSLTYTIYEYKQDFKTNTSASVNASSWKSGNITLHSDTRYILIAFKNGDGSTDFSESGLLLLKNAIQGLSELINLKDKQGTTIRVSGVNSFTDMKFTSGYALASYGSFVEANNRYSSVGYALMTNGGECISLKILNISGVTLSYNIIEFKEDGTVNTNGTNNAWTTQKTILHSDTRYVLICFRNGDGTTQLPISVVSSLNTCVEKYTSFIEMINGGQYVVKNI